MTTLLAIAETGNTIHASQADVTGNWREGDDYLPHVASRQPAMDWKNQEQRTFRQTLALPAGAYQLTVGAPGLAFDEGRPLDWRGTIKAGDGPAVALAARGAKLDFTVADGGGEVKLELRHSLGRPVDTRLSGPAILPSRPLTYAAHPTGGQPALLHGVPFFAPSGPPPAGEVSCHGAKVNVAHFLGMIHSEDVGNGSWYSPKGDHSLSHFVGDQAGTIEIQWADGQKTFVPLIFGFNLWWSRPWDLAWHGDQFGAPGHNIDEIIFGGPAGDKHRDDIENILALVDGHRVPGAKTSDRRFIFSLDLGGRAVAAMKWYGVRELAGRPVISAVTLETAEPVEKLPPLPLMTRRPPRTKVVTLDAIAQKAYEPGVRRLMRIFYTFVDELPRLKRPAIPAGYFGPGYDFQGCPEAIYAACFLYRNGPECGSHVPASGVGCASPVSSGRLAGLYREGMGVWALNRPLFGSLEEWFKSYTEKAPGELAGRKNAWTRGAGKLLREAKAFGYGKHADAYIDWLDQCLFTEAKPPHWNRVAGAPDFCRKRRQVGNTIEEGVRENDGHGNCMWGRYMVWQGSGKPREWNEKRWKATEAAVAWIQWQLDTDPIFPGKGKDVLYTESECAWGAYDIYSSFNCLHGLKLSIRMAEQLGREETVRKWRALYARLRLGIRRHLVEADGTWHTEAKCEWQDHAHALVPVTLSSDGDSFTPLQDYAAGDELDREFLRITRATYRRLMRDKNYNCIRMYGYGQGYMTQAALLLDEMNDAEQFINVLVRHSYLPHMAGWACPEGIILHRSGKYYLPVNGYAGQDSHLAEATKAMRLMLGVDDNDPRHIRLVPRYPAQWTRTAIEDWPVLTGDDRQTCRYTYERSAERHRFVYAFEKPLKRLSVRLGPIPAGATVSRATALGREIQVEIEPSGDSRWVWIRDLTKETGEIKIIMKRAES